MNDALGAAIVLERMVGMSLEKLDEHFGLKGVLLTDDELTGLHFALAQFGDIVRRLKRSYYAGFEAAREATPAETRRGCRTKQE